MHFRWPLITDADFFLDQLDPELFPGISKDIEVHNGFAEEHAKYISLLHFIYCPFSYYKY